MGVLIFENGGPTIHNFYSQFLQKISFNNDPQRFQDIGSYMESKNYLTLHQNQPFRNSLLHQNL